MLKNNMMDDRFNDENESFMQETELMDNEYSINLPTRFYFEKKWHKGWINVVNPFRATIVLGTPGSGKSYAVINSFIKQMIYLSYYIACAFFWKKNLLPIDPLAMITIGGNSSHIAALLHL